MGKPSGSTLPEAKKLADQQFDYNIRTAGAQSTMNNVNQFTPYGSLQYTKAVGTDGVPSWTATTKLTPAQQRLLNRNTQVNQAALNTARRDLARMPAAGKNPAYQQYGAGPQLQTSLGTNDWSTDRQRVEDALVGRLNTQSDRDRSSLESRLANQGIAIGSDAYTRAMGDFDRGLSENRTNAILGAGQEQNRLQQLALNAGNFSNQALQQGWQNDFNRTGGNNDLRDRTFNNQNTLRMNNVNEINALRGGGQMTQPQFSSGGNTALQGVDYAGIANDQANQQLQQQNQFNNILGGLFGLGSSLLSDRRAKTGVKKIGATDDDQPIYKFRYKRAGGGAGPTQIGLMAQDVEKKRPKAVKSVGGLKLVDYGKALAGTGRK